MMMPLLSTPQGRRKRGCRGGAIATSTSDFGSHWRKPFPSNYLLRLIALRIFRPSDDPTPAWPRQWQLVKYRAKKTCRREENPTMKIDFVGLFSRYYYILHTYWNYLHEKFARRPNRRRRLLFYFCFLAKTSCKNHIKGVGS